MRSWVLITFEIPDRPDWNTGLRWSVMLEPSPSDQWKFHGVVDVPQPCCDIGSQEWYRLLPDTTIINQWRWNPELQDSEIFNHTMIKYKYDPEKNLAFYHGTY